MRVALISPFTRRPGLSSGGVESVAECLVASLAKVEGVAVDVVAPAFDGHSAVERRDFGNVHWLPHPKPAFLSYWTVFRRRVHQRLRELAPDIAHFQGYAGWALGYRPACVVTIHGIPELDTRFSGRGAAQMRSLVIGRIESQGRARADAKIVINPYVSHVLGPGLGGPHWGIENPVHPDFFSVSRKTVAGRLLYVGRISQRKNIESLLQAFARVAQVVPRATLRLAGSADDAAFQVRCEALCKTLGIGGRVSWLGNLPRTRLLDEFATAAALVLVSHQETAPMAIAEAMAASLPVVASRICGNPHLVSEGQTGWLVDQTDVEDIARGLVCALDVRVNQEAGVRARIDAIERFAPDRVAARTLAVYASVLDHHGAQVA